MWAGILVPAGAPRDIIVKLNREITRITALPDIKERLAGEGAELTPSSPEAFSALIVSEIDRLGTIARAAKMRND